MAARTYHTSNPPLDFFQPHQHQPHQLLPRPQHASRNDTDPPLLPASSSSSTLPHFANARDHADLGLVSRRHDNDPNAITSSRRREDFSITDSAITSAPRNRSPYSRHHVRSRSSGAVLLSAPVIMRAKSMPDTSPPTPQPSTSTTTFVPRSPNMAAMRNPATAYPVRASSPLRLDDGNVPYYASSPPQPPRSPASGALSGSAVQTIQEDSELELTPRATMAPPPLPAASAAFARSSSLRRRPASPLHSLAVAQSMSSIPTTPTTSDALASGSSSPALGPTRYANETYPVLHHFSSTSSFSSFSSFSSVPSTPSSARSRSPSISSLDTIEDSPDLESEAIEVERLERLKLAAERAERAERGDDVDGSGRRRSSLDVPRSGFGRGRAGSEKKRWSICGGERRGDLDLETIWED